MDWLGPGLSGQKCCKVADWLVWRGIRDYDWRLEWKEDGMECRKHVFIPLYTVIIKKINRKGRGY
jgi:hypothetical protein